MAWIQKNIFFFFRLLTSLALLACLAPAPAVPAKKAATGASTLSLIPMEIRLVIRKSRYTLTLYRGNMPVKKYRAVFGRGYQDGDKRVNGDRRTPEGDFYICTMNHSKRFYKFIGLSYPGLKHAQRGLQSKLITPEEYQAINRAIAGRQPPPWDTRLGGAIGIHGRTLDGSDGSIATRYFSSSNWTDGCVALGNADMDEIFSVVSLGTAVSILP